DDDTRQSLIRVSRGRGYGFNATVERFGTGVSRKPLQERRFTIYLVGFTLIAVVLIVTTLLFLRNADDRPVVSPYAYSDPGPGLQEGMLADSYRAPDVSDIDPVAYQAYLDGKILRRTFDLVGAKAALRHAIDIEPRFAAAYAELAICEIGGYVYQPGLEVKLSRDKAIDLAARSLELDPTLPEAYAAGVAIAIFLDWNWTRAEVLLKQGLAISPDDEYLLAYLSLLTEIRGDTALAIRLTKPLVARDSTNTKRHYRLGNTLYKARRFREAVDAYQTALKLDPERPFIHLGIGRIHALQGDAEAALREMEQETHPTFRLYGLVIAHSSAGNETAAILALNELLEQGMPHLAYWVGSLYAYRGEIDEAFAYLDMAYELRDKGLLGIRTDPLLDNIREDPRFNKLLLSMNLD
ncbi:MAG: tetratricopeptide repeat protein, partial [Xanthomonadales bacterium]|nr:tetratricopeptide repeat protein [Xanthomonadales bacterium]